MLRDRLKVTPAVLQDVETEVRYNRPFRSRFERPFENAVAAGTLVALETRDLESLLSARGVQPAQIPTEIRAYKARATQYRKHVQDGEAQTHAAAVQFGLPVMSNDKRAIDTLVGLGLPLATPTLRFFDVLVCGRTLGIIDLAKAEKVRARLLKAKEFVPKEFKRSGDFDACAGSFTCRLVGVPGPLVGPTRLPQHYDDVLYLPV